MASPANSTTTSSYVHILKSTAMVGGSTVINTAFAIFRNKAMAVLLGPEGLGLMGMYNIIADLTQTLAGFGIQSSGVRQIAEAAGGGDAARIARTTIALRRVSVLLGVAGAALLIAFSLPVANFTFGDGQHAAGIALLSAAVFFRVVSAGQAALIQGMRRIAHLVQINVLGALASTVIGIPLVLFFGEKGIVPALVAMAAVSTFTSWWYSRKIEIAPVVMTARQVGEEAGALLKLGFAFMASGFLAVGAAYAIRIMVLRNGGIEAAGLYQAAWTLGGFYAGFILQAMGADFYPRLTAISADNAECNRLVNEQAQVSILLAGPGLIATLSLAPLVMTLLYSTQFYAAVDLLRWICMGMMLRIVAWPIGFIVLAKGLQKIFFWTEVAAALVHVGLAWLLIARFGTVGAGAAFFGLYVWHSALVYLIARRVSGFRWSAANCRLIAVFLPAAGFVFSLFFVLPFWYATGIGMTIAFISSLWSLRLLLRLLPAGSFPMAVRPWLPKAV